MAKQDTLKQIVEKKKERIAQAKERISQEELKEAAANLAPTRGFLKAINKPRQISLIAEIKQASPAQGIIRRDFDLAQICSAYEQSGVQAVSVLTEEDFFLGRAQYISQAKQLLSVPVMRKDFILEAYQVYESRYLGADAILLIAELLTKDKITEFMQIAEGLGLDCLVEVHDEKELKKVLRLKVPAIGINNRSLRTLEVDFKTTERLFTLIPKGKIVVVESGIKSYQDTVFLKILGANAVLIGTAFMQEADIRKKVEEVMGW